jgi:hypothetical protein
MGETSQGMASRPLVVASVVLFGSGFAWVLIGVAPSVGGGLDPLLAGRRSRPTKNPLAVSAQEVAGERDVALAVR